MFRSIFTFLSVTLFFYIQLVDDCDQEPLTARIFLTTEEFPDPLSPAVTSEASVAAVLLEAGLAITAASLKRALGSRRPPPRHRWLQPRDLGSDQFQGRVEWLDEHCVFFVSPLAWAREREEVHSVIQAALLRRSGGAIFMSKYYTENGIIIRS